MVVMGYFAIRASGVGLLGGDHGVAKGVLFGTQPKPSMMHRRTGFFAIKVDLLMI